MLLNDPIFVESARVFAQHILQTGGRGFDNQLTWAFQRALNRAPAKEERKILSGLYMKNFTRFRRGGEAAQQLTSVGEAPQLEDMKKPELAAMTTVARAILNLHETITRN